MHSMTKDHQTKTLGIRKPEFKFVSHLICGSPIFWIQSRKELQGFMVILCLTVLGTANLFYKMITIPVRMQDGSIFSI